ncbi:polysaccharide biosynthesis/export family protein [Saccharicrinis aurantiacus]|uniref:polysaccharide biosynthesis/export family protein n=1 Tax=Saccharicrinis aurantiacus TaxID=1849719 RepID=UPI0008398FE8|nr:polysaccharide biosynthesis/export family protein [Saccharicrinis aurantiacus]
MNKSILGVTLFVLLFTTGCVSLKKSIYLQGHITKELDEVDQYYKPDKSDYLIKPNDNLYIRINSLDERTSAFLNNDGGSATANISSPMSASLQGYRVQLDGSIQFPFVGKIHVSGLSLDEVREKIQLAVSKYVEECSVNVKLLNDNITILGEVKSPGRFLLYAEEVNILEAISMAGDMTDFANKEKIRLIRKEGDVQQMLEINTLDERIIYSPYYYLKPGDIIYVEPRKLKSMALSNIPLGLSLTFLNTALLLFALFN